MVRVMQPAYVPVWMRKPIPLLDDDKPLDVIADGEYRRTNERKISTMITSSSTAPSPGPLPRSRQVGRHR
jgi:hypothetical protein